MVDIARPDHLQRKLRRRAAYGAAASVLLLSVVVSVSRLEPAAPTVDRATLWIDTVKRGAMVRDVRGTGTLVPEDTRWIPATTTGRVEHIVLRPGSPVIAESVILELSNPALEQELQDTRLKLKSAEANLTTLRVQLETEQLQQQASTASIEADYRKAVMQAEVNQQLAAKQLVSALLLRQSQLDAQQLAVRYEIATQQVAKGIESMRARIAAQESDTDQIRALMQLKLRHVHELRVRAGRDGVLQFVPVEVGQQVAPGTNLARVANPATLKAELKIPETQAKDVQPGQRASIDTRNGLIDGEVVRVDPSVQNGTVTVDVALRGSLPKGARPDLTVDGTIELERLNDALYVGRPASAQEQITLNVFKLTTDGMADRIAVKIGRSSVNSVEVLAGLQAGDRVILSDMSAWDGVDRVRLQ
jgi:HlyD family secretion protein